MVSTHFQRAFIFHMPINGLSEDMNPIDIEFTRSKVNVTRVTFVKIVVFAHYLENNLSLSFHIS